MGSHEAIRKQHKPKLVWGFVSTTLGTLALISSQVQTSALAQEQQPSGSSSSSSSSSSAAAVEEVTVTGTRIKRPDLEAQSPIVTIDAAQLESKAGLNVESYLNQLPQYNPATTPTNGGQLDVQANGLNTVGITTISLRGLGSNRSLVLVDGHRATPADSRMDIDVNTIPAIMLDRIEQVSGGASAVYGADAMGGVTNFITKHNFQGFEVDVQDGITQVGDDNELRVAALMGTKIGDGRGNMVLGAEYYNRNAAYEKNRSFFTKGFNDPNVASGDLFLFGFNGYDTLFSPPSYAAQGALFPNRGTSNINIPKDAMGNLLPIANGCSAVAGSTTLEACPSVFGYPLSGNISGLRFNSDGSLFDTVGPLASSGYLGPTSGNGYALQNVYDATQPNNAFTPPTLTQQVKWNDQNALASEPQTRYSFFANGTYDITDKVQFYTNLRFSQSRTQTVLFPANASYGWEAPVPYAQATDDPIQPGLVTSATPKATLTQIASAFQQYGMTSANPYYNTGYLANGVAGAQHPVPWQLAMLLDSRAVGGPPVTCNPSVTVFPIGQVAARPPTPACSSAPTSWIAETYPLQSSADRATTDTSTQFTIETGFRFPIVADWTGDVYYSRGQTTEYVLAYGDNSLERWRAVIASPDYGRGLAFQGNANGASPEFGTTVPTTCTSGFYNSLFMGDAAPTADCENAVAALLQTETQLQQDIVQGEFQGSLPFKTPGGTPTLLLGYQYRRNAAQFYPDGLQSTNSFTDQVIGVYPTAALDAKIAVKDGYTELYLPVVNDLGFLKKLNLDLGGRYSSYDFGESTTTFKVDMDAHFGQSVTLRGGFNRASRAPNIGELYLNEQELFGAAPQFGDPCSLRSPAPFGAGGAVSDGPNGTNTAAPGTPPNVIASGQTQAGATSTYLICQAQMGAAGANQYYNHTTQPSGGGGFGWVNQIGNPDLRSETANTWTAGLVFDRLGDSPWVRGLSATVDYYRIDIKNAIGLDSADFANYLCYGQTTVTTAAEAQAQALTPACQNVGRNLSTGGTTTALLTFTNQGTLSTSGIDFGINYLLPLRDVGIPLPGSFTFNSNDTYLNFYRTKQSPANFDVLTEWKGSLGPTLYGTNAGAYSYRLFNTFGYMLPSFSLSLRWAFYPSVESAAYAAQQAIIANNNRVAAGGAGTLLSYTPSTSIAAPHYNRFDLFFSWNINSTLSVRGGINNLFNQDPVVTGASRGYPVGTNLSAVCSKDAATKGCQNPFSYSLPSSGYGITNGGFYDVYGRTFFLGLKADL